MIQKIEFGVRGMHCDGCARSVQNALLRVGGVKTARLELGAGKAIVEFDNADCSKEQLAKAVNGTGKTAVL